MVTNYLKQEQYNFSVLIVGIFHTNHDFMLFLRHANDDYSMCTKGALTTEDRLWGCENEGWLGDWGGGKN